MKWFEKLKFARKVKGLTCKDVEKLSGISNAYINEIENGKIKDPSYFKIVKLLELYNLEHTDI
jgi:transcriptional regulator with XRE-family HTH domain